MTQHDMGSVGIHAFGGYVPRLRLARSAIAEANAWFNPALKSLGKGERSMCNWDEDAVTMAVEAARDCLARVDRSTLGAVFLASTSAPFQDRQNAGIVAEALGLGRRPAPVGLAPLGRQLLVPGERRRAGVHRR